VRTVGTKTARNARLHGAEAEALGENVEEFVAHADALTGPVLVARGVHTRGDLAERLRGRGLEVEESVLYDQVAVPLSRAAQMVLAGSSPVVAPVFSPRSASLLAAKHASAPMTVLAISEATAAAWTGNGTVVVASSPDAAAMCALVAEAF
jgi:uroporphyrinogen-III synthase